MRSGDSIWEQPENGIIQCHDDDGNPYFLDAASGATAWSIDELAVDPPAAAVGGKIVAPEQCVVAALAPDGFAEAVDAGCSGFVLAFIHRDDSALWRLRRVLEPVVGSTFAESGGAIREALEALIPASATTAHTLRRDATFIMQKGDIAALPRSLFIHGSEAKLAVGSLLGSEGVTPPPRLGGADLFVGLGWKCPAKNIDLDASVIASDGNGKLACVASYTSLDAIPGVLHTGDNTTGEGSGDDERLFLDLDQIPFGIKEVLYTRVCLRLYSLWNDPCSAVFCSFLSRSISSPIIDSSTCATHLSVW